MKNFNIFLLAVLLLFTGCDGDENFLTKSPTDIFVDEDVWKNEALIMGLVSDLYSRYADYQTIEKWYSFCDLDEGYCSNAVDRKRHQNATWGYGEQASWDYGYVRHMNLFLQKCARADASVFAKNSRERLMGEVRFLRAAYYFAMAKRMGGVPLITEPMQYDYSGDVTGWMYAPESKDTVANLLVSIDTVAHGSAGGSLHQANALLDGSEDPAILDDAGDAGFDLKAVSSDRVDGLNKTVTKLLRDAGVTDEWKNHTDLEPFNAA